MANLVLRIGSRSAQGVRSNNEDRFVADPSQGLFLVADGMGGQERGELASGMAADLIPRIVHDRLAANDPADQALRHRRWRRWPAEALAAMPGRRDRWR